MKTIDLTKKNKGEYEEFKCHIPTVSGTTLSTKEYGGETVECEFPKMLVGGTKHHHPDNEPCHLSFAALPRHSMTRCLRFAVSGSAVVAHTTLTGIQDMHADGEDKWLAAFAACDMVPPGRRRLLDTPFVRLADEIAALEK